MATIRVVTVDAIRNVPDNEHDDGKNVRKKQKNLKKLTRTISFDGIKNYGMYGRRTEERTNVHRTERVGCDMTTAAADRVAGSTRG